MGSSTFLIFPYSLNISSKCSFRTFLVSPLTYNVVDNGVGLLFLSGVLLLLLSLGDLLPLRFLLGGDLDAERLELLLLLLGLRLLLREGDLERDFE